MILLSVSKEVEMKVVENYENVEEVLFPEEKDDTNGLTAFVKGFVEGHIACCVISFWALTIAAIFMRLFKHKELGWVDIVK